MTPSDYHIILMQIVFRVCVCCLWTEVHKRQNIALDGQTYLIITVIFSWVLFLLVCTEF